MFTLKVYLGLELPLGQPSEKSQDHKLCRNLLRSDCCFCFSVCDIVVSVKDCKVSLFCLSVCFPRPSRTCICPGDTTWTHQVFWCPSSVGPSPVPVGSWPVTPSPCSGLDYRHRVSGGTGGGGRQTDRQTYSEVI